MGTGSICVRCIGSGIRTRTATQPCKLEPPTLSVPSCATQVRTVLAEWVLISLCDSPIRLLDAYHGTRLHYLDVSGTSANCLADFGGHDEMLSGVTKLYAGRCRLRSLHGLERCELCHMPLKFNT